MEHNEVLTQLRQSIAANIKWAQVDLDTPDSVLKEILHKACIRLSWPYPRGWQQRLIEELQQLNALDHTMSVDSMAPVLAQWHKGDSRRPMKSLIVRFINDVLPFLLPEIAIFYPFGYDRISCISAEEFVDFAVGLLKDTETALVVESADGYGCTCVLTNEHLHYLESQVISETNTSRSPRKSLMKVRFNRNFPSDSLKICSGQWNDSYDKIESDLKSKYYIIVLRDGKPLRVITRRPDPSQRLQEAPVGNEAAAYAKVHLPQLIARRLLSRYVQDYIKRDGKIIDIAAAWGNAGFELRDLAKSLFGNDSVHITVAEDDRQVAFKEVFIEEKGKSGASNIVGSYKPDGRRNLVQHGHGYDLALINLVLLEQQALKQLPAILAKRGAVAIAYYDSGFLEKVFHLVIKAFEHECRLKFPMPKEIMLDLHGLCDYLETGGIHVVEGGFKLFPLDFSNSESFLEFICGGFPFVANCFWPIRHYSEAIQRVQAYIVKEIKAKRFFDKATGKIQVNFVVGELK